MLEVSVHPGNSAVGTKEQREVHDGIAILKRFLIQMKNSPSYLEIESMLQQGQVLMTFAELREFLDMFAQKGLITRSEHEALLALAQKLDSDKSPRQSVT